MSEEGLSFFRCMLCKSVVSVWDIKGEPHGCPHCRAVRIMPTRLSLWEKLVQIVRHPKIWAWPHDGNWRDVL